MPLTKEEELQSQLARTRASEYSYRRAFDKYYTRTRMLEAAIKKHARGECNCKSHGECLTRLVALTPVNPRPTIRQRGRRP